MKRAILALCALAGMYAWMTAARAEPVDARRVNKLLAEMASPATCPGALRPAADLTQTREFAALPPAYQVAFLYAHIQCAVTTRSADIAFASISKAEALRAPWAPDVLLNVGTRLDRYGEAIDGFNKVARRNASDLARLPPMTVWRIVQAARRVDQTGVQELSVYETLLSGGFKFPDSESDDILRVDHARLLLENGQIERARERLETVTEPRLLMGIRLTKLFDPLRSDPAFEKRLDLRGAAETKLAESQKDMAANPNQLSRVVQTAQALRDLGRNEEALRLLDGALARLRTFDDRREQENWALEERATALRMLGRSDRARRASRRATTAAEGGQRNVSQVINYAATLEAAGQPEEALAMLKDVGTASPYGDMWIAATRACAYDQLGDSVRRDVELAYLNAHEQDNVGARTRGLLCANKLDDTAAMYIRRVGTSSQRMDAILALQTYPGLRPAPNTRRGLLASRLTAVIAREDVQAALSKVGRNEPIPLETVYWGEL